MLGFKPKSLCVISTIVHISKRLERSILGKFCFAELTFVHRGREIKSLGQAKGVKPTQTTISKTGTKWYMTHLHIK